MKQPYRVLTIAGSDSGGGAGIQADLKTISALGCFGTSVITSLTAQNTLGVSDIHPVPVSNVIKQLTAVLDDIGADAVKIGMVYSAEIVKGITEVLKSYQISNIVVDPVMIATSGDSLIENDTIDALTKYLFPIATVITPNLKEAEKLLNRKILSEAELIESTETLIKFGSRAVIVKGFLSHGKTIKDVYFDKLFNETKILKKNLVTSNNLHGTGCTYSSAIASFLARGYDLPKAILKAKEFIHKAIQNGRNFEIGKGHGPVNHFFNPQKLIGAKKRI